MLPVVRSKVFYSDYSVEEIEGPGPPSKLSGVFFIIFYHEGKYKTTSSGVDYYYWPDGKTTLISAPQISDAAWEEFRYWALSQM